MKSTKLKILAVLIAAALLPALFISASAAEAVQKTFAGSRGLARKAFRALAGITAADLEVFDRLVDRLSDELLAEIRS